MQMKGKKLDVSLFFSTIFSHCLKRPFFIMVIKVQDGFVEGQFILVDFL